MTAPTDDAAAIADQAAEAIRALIHATQPAMSALEHPSDVYDVLGALETMAGRLPQTCGQLAGWLERQAEAGRVAATGWPVRRRCASGRGYGEALAGASRRPRRAATPGAGQRPGRRRGARRCQHRQREELAVATDAATSASPFCPHTASAGSCTCGASTRRRCTTTVRAARSRTGVGAPTAPALGTGDGQRVAYCRCPNSPYKNGGYVAKEVGPMTPAVRRAHRERRPRGNIRGREAGGVFRCCVEALRDQDAAETKARRMTSSPSGGAAWSLATRAGGNSDCHRASLPSRNEPDLGD
jgi:hypothetical protein